MTEISRRRSAPEETSSAWFPPRRRSPGGRWLLGSPRAPVVLDSGSAGNEDGQHTGMILEGLLDDGNAVAGTQGHTQPVVIHVLLELEQISSTVNGAAESEDQKYTFTHGSHCFGILSVLYVHLYQHRAFVCILPASTLRRRRSGIGRPWKQITDHSQRRKFNISLCPQSGTSSSLNPWRRRVPLRFWSRSRVSRAEDASLLLPVSVGSCIPDGARVSRRKRETFHHSFPTGPTLAQSELLLEASAVDMTFTPSHSKKGGARVRMARFSPRL
ncbi:hypothetical protein E1301_Tti016352 [Triplophysa tibetana]|uniref:Uncharacterized protein n=1 Tax=Triplophysa tibetana TaxID=1572043 RepID=A0A5A9NGA9_9TELE|nr:hypothetical protein E1301_Tti016352 [Triplophysa tibetana]